MSSWLNRDQLLTYRSLTIGNWTVDCDGNKFVWPGYRWTNSWSY